MTLTSTTEVGLSGLAELALPALCGGDQRSSAGIDRED
jgi:hypothetical protein